MDTDSVASEIAPAGQPVATGLLLGDDLAGVAARRITAPGLAMWLGHFGRPPVVLAGVPRWSVFRARRRGTGPGPMRTPYARCEKTNYANVFPLDG